MEKLDLTEVNVKSILESVETENQKLNGQSKPKLLGEFLFPIYIFLKTNTVPQQKAIIIQIYEQYVSEKEKVIFF